jgi:hypothetical protein
MGSFRFYRCVHNFPGMSVNVLRSGPSLSVGVRGVYITVGLRGVKRIIGIPGGGLFWTSKTGYHTGVHSVCRKPLVRVGQVTPAIRSSEWLQPSAIVLGLLIGIVAALVISVLLHGGVLISN